MSRERLLNVANLMSEITVTISELALQKHTAQKNSQRYLCRLINSVPDCIISTNSDNTVSMVNQAGAAMFGYKTNQIIGQPIQILLADERSRSTYLKNAVSNSMVIGEPICRPLRRTARHFRCRYPFRQFTTSTKAG